MTCHLLSRFYIWNRATKNQHNNVKPGGLLRNLNMFLRLYKKLSILSRTEALLVETLVFIQNSISFSISLRKKQDNKVLVQLTKATFSLGSTAKAYLVLHLFELHWSVLSFFFFYLRAWTDLDKGVCALVSTSINHPRAPPSNGVPSIVLASRYLVEPLENGKSRLTYISRVDQRWGLSQFCKGPWEGEMRSQTCPFLYWEIKIWVTGTWNYKIREIYPLGRQNRLAIVDWELLFIPKPPTFAL